MKRRLYDAIEPDEIFLDATNLPDHDEHQFEGTMERPLGRKSVIVLGAVFFCIALLFGWRAYYLQIAQGESFRDRSERNSLRSELVFSDRGVILDRNNQQLVWNTENPEGSLFSTRQYTELEGFSNLLGFVRYPKKDKNGFYVSKDILGNDGIEEFYNNKLTGVNGEKIVEVDAKGNLASDQMGILRAPIHGENINLSIDKDVQAALYKNIKEVAEQNKFTGGAGAIMDIKTGELIAMTTYPEYSSQVLSNATATEAIKAYATSKSTPYLNRFLSGQYAPGSIVKPFVALAVLEENIIDPQKKILSTGSISIPNPYFPDKKTVFNDWKAHGWVDMRDAIAVSSDVYFYVVGGGFQGQKGLGISNINKYMGMFGFGEGEHEGFFEGKDGVIPNPEWKKKMFKGDAWRIGDTYNTSIGQFGFQVTPYQALRATAALVNGGEVVEPTIIKSVDGKLGKVLRTVNFDPTNQKIVLEGMRQAVTDGTLTMLNTSQISIAGKSGTAQVGVNNEFSNSWIIGFYPYEKPKYAFVILMERAPKDYVEGAPGTAQHFFNWLVANKPEYAK